MKTKVLFVCSNNKDRSRTAEDMYLNNPYLETRSCGVDLGAVQPVTKDLVNWADVIVVMNEKQDRHAFKLHQKFPFLKPMGKRLIDFDIPNTYLRDAPALIDLIAKKMNENFPELLN